MAETHEKRPYLWVFLGLAVLTAAEVGVAGIEGDILGLTFHQVARVATLVILAAAKAMLVALYYMHLRYDKRILAIIGGFPFLLAIVMTLILLADRTLAGGVAGG
jgi:cytochrome c oxidase subunit IV